MEVQPQFHHHNQLLFLLANRLVFLHGTPLLSLLSNLFRCLQANLQEDQLPSLHACRVDSLLHNHLDNPLFNLHHIHPDFHLVNLPANRQLNLLLNRLLNLLHNQVGFQVGNQHLVQHRNLYRCHQLHRLVNLPLPQLANLVHYHLCNHQLYLHLIPQIDLQTFLQIDPLVNLVSNRRCSLFLALHQYLQVNQPFSLPLNHLLFQLDNQPTNQQMYLVVSQCHNLRHCRQVNHFPSPQVSQVRNLSLCLRVTHQIFRLVSRHHFRLNLVAYLLVNLP